jgi:hypothetical protein
MRYIVEQRKPGESAPGCVTSIVINQVGVSLGGQELNLSFFLMAYETPGPKRRSPAAVRCQKPESPGRTRTVDGGLSGT